MFRLKYALLTLAIVSTSLAAQRRTFGKTADADYGAVRPAGVKLSAGDVEDMNPAKLLLDKRKDLKLTDEQQRQLRAIVEQLKATNKASFAVLDSLRAESRPRIDADAEIEKVRTGVVREQMRTVVATIRATYDEALKGALAALDATQRPQADELVKKHADEAAKTLRETLGGGRGAGGPQGKPPE